MAVRLSTTDADATSAPWEPAGETIIQADGASEGPVVDIEARVQPEAEWVYVTSLRLPSERIVRLAQLPELRINMHGNPAGTQLTVYDNE
jgi:hypothetical protein